MNDAALTIASRAGGGGFGFGFYTDSGFCNKLQWLLAGGLWQNGIIRMTESTIPTPRGRGRHGSGRARQSRAERSSPDPQLHLNGK